MSKKPYRARDRSPNDWEAGGSRPHAHSLFTDITERKRAEDAIGQLAAIVESSDDAIYSNDLNDVIRSWNKGAEKLFGYAAEEVIGKSILILIPPNRADEETRVLESVSRGEKIAPYETVRRRKEGALIEISMTVSPLRNDAGNVIGASKISRDITERKRSEERLRESKQQYESLVWASAQIVWEANAEGTAETDSPSWREFTGQSLDEYKG